MTGASNRRAIEPVDTIWLNMDRPDNLMVIESLVCVDRPMDWDRYIATVRRRAVERYPAMRQRPVGSSLPLVAPHWEDDPDFDLERHFRRVRLPSPGDDHALQDYIAGFLDRPLPRHQPLWEMHLIDGYGDGSVVYSRLHHALADGIALMRVLLSLTDATPDADLDPEDDGPIESPARSGLLDSPLHLASALGHAVAAAPHLATPVHALQAASAAASMAVETTGVAAKLLLSRNPSSPLKGHPGPRKRVVWNRPVPLDDVVELAHRTGTTVNDVVIAALAGALSRYQLQEGVEPHDVPTMVPVNVRPLDEPLPPELGNRFALVLLSLPSGQPTSFARLAEAHRRMQAIKDSPEVFLTFGLIRGIGRTGPHLERALVDFFANKATGVTTNVPGPRSARYLAGARVTKLLGWAPGSGEQTLNTCICSYDGQLFVGFKVDEDTVAHPERLVLAFEAELVALCAMAPAPDDAASAAGASRPVAQGATR